MGFTKKTWKNRIAEYINRRLITMEDGSTNLVTVARDEGTISQEGDAFNAANMNDLEDRIEAGFDEFNQSLTTENGTKFRFGQNSEGEYGYIVNKDGADTVIPFNSRNNRKYFYKRGKFSDGVTVSSTNDTYGQYSVESDHVLVTYCPNWRGEIHFNGIDVTDINYLYIDVNYQTKARPGILINGNDDDIYFVGNIFDVSSRTGIIYIGFNACTGMKIYNIFGTKEIE